MLTRYIGAYMDDEVWQRRCQQLEQALAVADTAATAAGAGAQPSLPSPPLAAASVAGAPPPPPPPPTLAPADAALQLVIS